MEFVTMKDISILVTYYLKPNTTDKFLSELLEAKVPETFRKDRGCLAYEYYIPAYNNHSNVVVLLETWKSKEFQSVHLRQPNMRLLKEIKDKYVIHTEVKYL